MPVNVVLAQSGGPSPVINNSLRGVVEACRDYPDVFGRIYGAWHGIEGILKEELIDLGAESEEEIRLLRTTPAAGAIGTCRYKLREHQTADFQRIIDVFKAHDIGHFFYIGGNDSMDTALKISELAQKQGVGLAATGIPKTIDNDLGDAAFKLIDHTPGYGSAARYWAWCVQNAEEENRGSAPCDPVLVLQIMGRRMGFIVAAARLADPERVMPLQLYMPEAGLALTDLADRVNDELKRSGRCIVALSEGFDVGDIDARRDAFGHVEFGASGTTAQQVVTNYLNAQGLAASGMARGQTPGTDQRSSMLHASLVDLDEAYAVARHAVDVAAKEGGGWMATLLRGEGADYRAYYDKVPLARMANSERPFPRQWITPDGLDVTDEFVRYARPLIGVEPVSVPMVNGLQRFARLRRVFVEKRCVPYSVR